MADRLPRFNKVGSVEFEAHGDRRVVLTYFGHPSGPREQSPHICAARLGQMAAIPTLFDLPPAKVEHDICLHMGDDRCVYDVRWIASARGWTTPVALVVGGGLGAVIAGPWGAAAGVAVGGLVARMIRLQRTLDARLGELFDHGDALLRSAEANERRFGELLLAKADVEQQVVERTAALEEASRRLTHALDELQELHLGQKRFFANISHDLRTPLQLIVAPLEALASGQEPPGGRDRALVAMRACARQLERLIDQILDLARAEQGAVELRRQPVDARQLVVQTVEAFATAAASQDIDLQLHCPDAPVLAMLDADWLESALANLTSNALRSTDAATLVRVGLDVTDDYLDFIVEDRGPGVPAEERELVFDRFFQAAGKNQRVGSLGLGLAIVRETARLHEGEVCVEQADPHGARFRLHLPRCSVADGVVPADRSGPEAVLPVAEMAEPMRDGPSAHAPLALVAEDHPDVAAFVLDVLAERCRVRHAPDGQAALELARELNPDIIITDVSMPRMTGLELCRALREDPTFRHTPVILLTAHRRTDDVVAGYAAGADDYVGKPFYARELLARVDVQLRMRALIHRVAHQERLASLGRTASELAHQIRNPLNVVSNGFEVVARSAGDAPSVEAMAELVREGARRISRITDDLLELAGFDDDPPMALDPRESLDLTVRMMQATWSDAPVLKYEVPPASHRGQVVARPGELANLWSNLLDNARHAVGENGRVRVVAADTDDGFQVDVEDSGPGVSPEDAQRIFEPFYTTRSAGDGTGLGLSIAMEVALKRGGDLRLGRSEYLGGARFTVVLPYATGDSKWETTPVSAPSRTASSTSRTPRPRSPTL